MLKRRKPGLLVADPLAWWEKYVVRSGIRVLAIRTRHIVSLAGLPDLHKDPFDRILVAQAIAEGLDLVTNDEPIGRYPVRTIW